MSATNYLDRVRCNIAYGQFEDPAAATLGPSRCFLCQVWLTPLSDETLPTVIACVSFGLN